MKEPEITITIRTGNDAFRDGNGAMEFARILREIADFVEQGERLPMTIRDINGQRVGETTGSIPE